MESGNLYDTLVTYSESDFYPYHMPGHKRRKNIGAGADCFNIDITEIDGFDNLYNAEGIIRKAQERAADLYGADDSFFLVNGSTCGVLAAIMSVTDRADEVLIARNCHKSVYHAAYLQELKLHYIYPDIIEEYDIYDAISPEAVKAALELYPESKAVVITSPTYEGIISDISQIAEIVHSKGRILIVDEAHGAHLGLSSAVPENAVRQGADLAIHSLHKTLPSMTQTALLHLKGSYVNQTKLRRYLSIFQTSSPSYVMMSSIDSCISYMRENAAGEFDKLGHCYKDFIIQMKDCRHIRIAVPELSENGKYNFLTWDICKLVISVKGTSISGQELYDILRDEFHLQMEMSAATYVLAIMTIADEWKAWKRLADALIQIDGRIDGGTDVAADSAMEEGGLGIKAVNICHRPASVMTISQALASVSSNPREVALEQAQGKISGDFVNIYPPGIPLLVPGEVIDEEVIEQIRYSLELGLNVQGVSSEGTVFVTVHSD